MRLRPTRLTVAACLICLSAATAGAQPAAGSLLTPSAFSRETRAEGLARTSGGGERDSLWNGILIGAGAGALYGLAIAPPQFCGHNDPECAAIVKVVIGVPSIAGGAAVGAVVDYFIGRHPPDRASRRRRLYVTPVAAHGVRGVQAQVQF